MEAPSKRQRGRPTRFTEEVAAELCARLSQGEPLAQICRDEHMPAVATVSDWKARYPAFSVSIARGRDEGFDAIAADCLKIADNTDEDAQSRRVRIEARLKLLAKWDYRRYGDRVGLDIATETKFIPLDELADKVRRIQLENNRLLTVGEPEPA